LRAKTPHGNIRRRGGGMASRKCWLCALRRERRETRAIQHTPGRSSSAPRVPARIPRTARVHRVVIQRAASTVVPARVAVYAAGQVEGGAHHEWMPGHAKCRPSKTALVVYASAAKYTLNARCPYHATCRAGVHEVCAPGAVFVCAMSGAGVPD